MNNQPIDRSDGLARLAALAERFASEGQMNLNKLAEAALYAEVRRLGWRYRPQITVEMMQSELEACLQALKQDGFAPEMIAALETGRRVLAEHRRGDLLIEEAPDVFVCRTCGHATLGSPPDRCPECGSWPGRFRKFVAIFNGDNIEPANPIEVKSLLANNARDLERLVGGLSEEAMMRKPEGSDWSIHDHIAHFYDTQEILDTRIDLMLNQDNPELTAVAIYALATEAGRHPASTHAILAEFRDKRARCITRLEATPLKDLWRPGWHTEFGRLTILRRWCSSPEAAYMAYHEQTHLPEIEALVNPVTGGI